MQGWTGEKENYMFQIPYLVNRVHMQKHIPIAERHTVYMPKLV